MQLGDGFMSEDGSTFTVLKDNEGGKQVANDDIDDDNDPMSLINKVDVSSLPEEQRPVFTKLIEATKTALSEVSSLREKGDIAAALKQTLESIGAQRKGEDKPADGSQRPRLADKLKFEEGDYYAPFFKQLAGTLDEITDQIDSLGRDAKLEKVSSFQKEVVSFIKNNNVPEKVVLKMDELAKTMGSGVYNDLPRLRKLANLELGVVENKPAPKDDNVNDRLNNRLETRSRMRTFNNVKQDAPPKNMKEAWDRAENQLSGE